MQNMGLDAACSLINGNVKEIDAVRMAFQFT